MSGVEYWLVEPCSLSWPLRRQQDAERFKLPLRLLGGNLRGGYILTDVPHALVTPDSFLFRDPDGRVWLVRRVPKAVSPERGKWLLVANNAHWRACLVSSEAQARYFLQSDMDNGTLAVDPFGNTLRNYCGESMMHFERGNVYIEDGVGNRGPKFGPLVVSYDTMPKVSEYFGWED